MCFNEFNILQYWQSSKQSSCPARSSMRQLFLPSWTTYVTVQLLRHMNTSQYRRTWSWRALCYFQLATVIRVLRPQLKFSFILRNITQVWSWCSPTSGHFCSRAVSERVKVFSFGMKGWLLGAKILWLTASGNCEGVLTIVEVYILLFYILVHYLLSQGFSAELMIVSYVC